MPLGIHSYHGYAISRHHQIKNIGDYYLGRYVGDHSNDESFWDKLKRVEKKLDEKFGRSGYTKSWSPFTEKPYKPLTDLQKYKKMVTKTYNEHHKKCLKIINDNTLFVDDFLAEEQKKLSKRIQVLKQRYKQ